MLESDCLGGEVLLDGADGWSRHSPDGLLADSLAYCAAASSDDPGDQGARLERAGAWERVIAWAQACQIREIAGFVSHAEQHSAPGQCWHETVESAVAEVGLMLSLSPRTANGRVSEAVELAQRLPATLTALEAGDISLSVVRVMRTQTAHLTDAEAGQVERAVLPKARGRTPAQIRGIARRAVIKTDPDAARRREAQQRRERTVGLHHEPDGMATLSLFGPAPDVVQVYALADECARRSGAADDGRSMDARRADALVDLVTNGPVAGCDREPAPCPGGDDDTNSAAGASCVADTDGARECHAHGRGPSPQARSRPQPGKPVVGVTVGLSTLLGLDQQPGELAGYGPITAQTAREIAADATWRRLVTDPVSGAVLDYGTTRYTPPVGLAAHVVARDARCRFPGCRVPASKCDLDHGVPFEAGGTTSAVNLTAKCRKHHRLKHLPGWNVSQDAGGTVTWTTPSGHAYTTVPPPQAEPKPSGKSAPAANARGRDPDDPPPF